jgi:putative DNA primase/helicase
MVKKPFGNPMNITLDKHMTTSLDDLISSFSGDFEKNRSVFMIDDPSFLQEHFTMIHGTDCVYDGFHGKLMKSSHLRLSSPTGFKLWQTNPSRKCLDLSAVVFDPACNLGENYINLFTGLPHKQKKGDISLITDHLLALCMNDESVYDWVIKWIAYPLQYPGAKMKSSIVMHGKQGTGKNIFWDAILEIYGKYGITVTQTQVESEYTDWMSAKLFVLANEVLSRRERRHIKGRLKDLITGDKLLINQKFMSTREERNYCNMVFLSNEPDAVDTDNVDRRFMIINAETVYSAEYYKELAESIDIPALYHFFMNVDLSDFNEHTKPIENGDKKALIRLNMRSDQLFIDEWLNGVDSPFPKQSIPSLMLYWAYRCWCAERGEPYPVTETKFGRTLNDYGLNKSSRESRPYNLSTQKRISMIWLDDPKSSVSDFEFQNFDDILSALRSRYRI